MIKFTNNSVLDGLIKLVCVGNKQIHENVSRPIQNGFETQIWFATHRLRNTGLRDRH